MEVKFRILHISDLHIYDSTDWNIMKVYYQKFASFFKPNYLIITGDFRHKKNQPEFSKALIFLNDLVRMLGIEKDKVFMVPGNHDVDEFTHRDLIINDINEKIQNNPDTYVKYMNPKEDDLRNGFKEYSEFVKRFYEGKVHDERVISPASVFCITKDNINFVMMNTALVSTGKKDEEQITDIQALSNLSINKEIPTIFIGHHSLSCLAESQRNRMEQLLNIHHANVYLCGDMHKVAVNSIRKRDIPNTNIPEFVCGKSAVETGDTFSDICIIGYECKIDGFCYVDVYEYKDNGFLKNSDFYINPNTPFSFRLFTPAPTTKVKGSKERRRGNRRTKTVEEREPSKEPESIWLPDAERAGGTQARFNSFTKTREINEFISPDSRYWGIASVKGIGKTFVLQVKRVKSSKHFLCLPKYDRPSAANNWATERISFDRYSVLKTDNIFDDLVLLWKIAIKCYVISVIKDKRCKEDIDKFLEDNRISHDIADICRSNGMKLHNIISEIVSIGKWNEQIYAYINPVTRILQRLLSRRQEEDSDSKPIAIFIDKVDQAIRQTNSEPPADCVACQNAMSYSYCDNPNKSEKYCSSEKGCVNKNCCYGCEVFASVESGDGLRIYEKTHVSRLIHVNIWQYLQLTLACAADQIQDEYGGGIRIFYTIRREALNCEQYRIGEHASKVDRQLLKLTYSMDLQEKIFNDCIRNQEPEYLFSPHDQKIRGKEGYAFVGIEELCHPYCKRQDGTNVTESLFRCIYRHSFDRNRDIQRFGEELTRNMERIRCCPDVISRGECVKQIIEDLAAELAYSVKYSDNSVNHSYYSEKFRYIPNYWTNSENFEHLLSLIDRNLLFEDDVRSICKEINGHTVCPGEGCIKGGCKHHPFSMLYNLGYLGCIKQNASNKAHAVQEFLDSASISYFSEKDTLLIDKRVAYIIHPSLTKTISKTFNKSMKRFKGFILGKNHLVEAEVLSQMLKDRKEMSEEEFVEKYYYSP